MTLLVRTPPGYEPERRHILDVVLSDWLGLEWRLDQHNRSDVRISAASDGDGPGVVLPDVLFGTDPAQWLTPASLPVSPLPRIELDGRTVPVLYGTGSPTVVEGSDVRLGVDVFGAAFAMLTRYEEAVVADRDEHGRFAAPSSVAGRERFLTVPVVDAYVELLWSAIEAALPRTVRRERTYQVVITHDVDDPLSTLARTPVDVVRQLGADVLRRKDAGLALRRARTLAMGKNPAGYRSDPHNTFDFLMDVSERNGLTSAFYFQSHREPNRGGGALYALEHPWIQALLRRVHARGHEIGYHAGFGTYLDPERTAAEFDHLRKVTGANGIDQPGWGGRQHYLQWAPSTTWRNWADAGLDHDCTLAFADAAGFRTGTCHEFTAFDLERRRPLPLRERPFQIMDVTLFGYMGMGPDDAAATVAEIRAECRRYRGTLGVLWHNDSVLRTAREKAWYAALMASLP